VLKKGWLGFADDISDQLDESREQLANYVQKCSVLQQALHDAEEQLQAATAARLAQQEGVAVQQAEAEKQLTSMQAQLDQAVKCVDEDTETSKRLVLLEAAKMATEEVNRELNEENCRLHTELQAMQFRGMTVSPPSATIRTEDSAPGSEGRGVRPDSWRLITFAEQESILIRARDEVEALIARSEGEEPKSVREATVLLGMATQLRGMDMKVYNPHWTDVEYPGKCQLNMVPFHPIGALGCLVIEMIRKGVPEDEPRRKGTGVEVEWAQLVRQRDEAMRSSEVLRIEKASLTERLDRIQKEHELSNSNLQSQRDEALTDTEVLAAEVAKLQAQGGVYDSHETQWLKAENEALRDNNAKLRQEAEFAPPPHHDRHRSAGHAEFQQAENAALRNKVNQLMQERDGVSREVEANRLKTAVMQEQIKLTGSRREQDNAEATRWKTECDKLQRQLQARELDLTNHLRRSTALANVVSEQEQQLLAMSSPGSESPFPPDPPSKSPAPAPHSPWGFGPAGI